MLPDAVVLGHNERGEFAGAIVRAVPAELNTAAI
jgi:hypothetical protein